MDGAHAPVAPSSAGRIVKCPASRVLAKGQDWTDEYADTTTRDEGTACHWVAETLARTGVAPEAGTVAPNGITVGADMLAAAREYVAALPPRCLIEQRIAIPDIPDCWGTLDAGCTLPDGTLFVADFKYGFRPIEVWPNYQIALYAYGLAVLLGKAPEMVTLRIEQPRAYHRAGARRDVHVPWSRIIAAVREVAHAVANPERANPGEHCKTCPGRVRCSALREVAHSVMTVVDEALPLPVIEREMLAIDRLSAVIDAYHDGLQLQFRRAVQQGERPTKYDLFRSAGAQAWNDPHAAQRVAVAMGKTLMRETPVTPAQARAIIGKDAVDALTCRKYGAFKIVPQAAQSWAAVFKK